ncbi:MAG TPA: hypothetical protein VK877_12770 [Pseudolabrys sp.]|jgi:hypothetical protein|nr:hypothetical protein [Pseudolabrys sp.]
MSEFAARTGLVRAIEHPRRYLWTDAFAVCNFLELSARTGEQKYREYANLLIDQVHHVLGRYREDDARSGWISGFDEEKGRRHPTAGGLRIGKALRERSDAEPFDERLEWDRDGQYFHYLTKWMHALCQTSLIESKPAYARWAGELASAAYQGFGAAFASDRGLVGIYWKMSTDLSRPLVFAMGSHDVLDGFITFREVQNAMTTTSGAEMNIPEAIDSLAALTQDRDWATDDPLGLGGLLFDACRLCRLSENSHTDAELLETLLDGCSRGLSSFLRARPLARAASHRLAFRELGLAIGLKAVAAIGYEIQQRSFDNRVALRRATDWLLRHESLGAEIIDGWLPSSRQQDESWRAHQDINDVMLATALIPDTFLSIGRPVR